MGDRLGIHGVVDILFWLKRTIISPEETFPREEEHKAHVNYLLDEVELAEMKVSV